MIEIYTVDIRNHLGRVTALEAVLSPDEIRRARRFKFKKDYHSFVITHGILRQILGEKLGCQPRDVKFQANNCGKPLLNQAHAATWHFNISHSNKYSMIALTERCPIGIDIEYMKNKQIEELANIVKRFFHQEEQTYFNDLPDQEKILGFYRLWTRKEAYIKAKGLGLYLDLNKFDVSYDIHSLQDLKCPRNYSAAIAWLGNNQQEINYQDFK